MVCFTDVSQTVCPNVFLLFHSLPNKRLGTTNQFNICTPYQTRQPATRYIQNICIVQIHIIRFSRMVLHSVHSIHSKHLQPYICILYNSIKHSQYSYLTFLLSKFRLLFLEWHKICKFGTFTTFITIVLTMIWLYIHNIR